MAFHNICEKHPQRQEIIDRLLAGESTRQIAEAIHPKVGQASISRFRIKMLGPAVRQLKGKMGKSKELKDVAIGTGVISNAHSDESPVQTALKQRIHEHIEQRISRRLGWIFEAERDPIVSPESGEVVGNRMDHKALAAHDRNEGGDLEFLSRLNGLLDSGAGSTTINIAVIAPVERGAEQEPADAVQVVDVSNLR